MGRKPWGGNRGEETVGTEAKSAVGKPWGRGNRGDGETVGTEAKSAVELSGEKLWKHIGEGVLRLYGVALKLIRDSGVEEYPDDRGMGVRLFLVAR